MTTPIEQIKAAIREIETGSNDELDKKMAKALALAVEALEAAKFKDDIAGKIGMSQGTGKIIDNAISEIAEVLG